MPTPLAPQQRMQFYAVAWGCLGALLGVSLHLLFAAPWLGAMMFAVPLAIAAAPISLSASYVCRAMPLRRTPVARVIVTTTLAAAVTAGVWVAVGRGWWLALQSLGVGLDPAPPLVVMAVLLGVGGLTYVLSVAVQYLFAAMEDTAEVEQRALKSEISAREAELRALRAQVDPHFLFNSLNSISGLIGSQPERARAMSQLLADFLRESLALGRAEWIPLSREVALARRYLEIEQVRFGARLEVVMTVAADAADIAVPPLILQPLVENAVRHGIATCLDGGRVTIDATRSGAIIVIVVTNPRDADTSAAPGAGLGLEIIRRRLAAVFDEEAVLRIEPGEGRFRVTMTLPVDAGPHTERRSLNGR